MNSQQVQAHVNMVWIDGDVECKLGAFKNLVWPLLFLLGNLSSLPVRGLEPPLTEVFQVRLCLLQILVPSLIL